MGAMEKFHDETNPDGSRLVLLPLLIGFPRNTGPRVDLLSSLLRSGVLSATIEVASLVFPKGERRYTTLPEYRGK